MIPSTLHLPLINLIATNFTTEEIDLIGSCLESRFSSHFHSGEPFGTTLRPPQAAKSMVNYFVQKGLLEQLIPIILRTESDISIVNRQVKIQGLDEFYRQLGTAGFAYEASQNAIVATSVEDDQVSWGYLKEGESYEFGFLSVDIVGNSDIQRKYSKEDIEYVYGNFFRFLKGNITKYRGKIWNWAGDGGLVAFYMGNKSRDSVRCALNIYLGMVLFNLTPKQNRFNEPIRLRIAAHMGQAPFRNDKGKILSEAINYVAHLEKKGTDTNGISISGPVFDNLDSRLQRLFQRSPEPFEGIDYYRLPMNLPALQ